MPSIDVSVPHALGAEEAIRRLQGGMDYAKVAYQQHLKDLQERWEGNTLHFDFHTFSIKVRGHMTAEPSDVKVHVELPFMAMMFKGTIEQQLRQHLATLLGGAEPTPPPEQT